MSWNVANASWALGAISIKPVRGNPPPMVFTQTPNFCSDFIMPAGGEVTATFFVKVEHGELSENPAITLRLSTGTNEFIALSPPQATSLGNGIYRLAWTGALSQQVSIPPGAAVTASLENGTKVPFAVVYGHQDYPSRISLPTTTVISMMNYGFYDAPYPGGQMVSGVAASEKVYIRATVTDPFGAYDITGLDLLVDGAPLVHLGEEHVVASDTCTKTYEYEWTPTSEGTYEITAVAHEGTDGITA